MGAGPVAHRQFIIELELSISVDFGISLFFFFNHTAPPKIYTLSLHDALPIYDVVLLSPTYAMFDVYAQIFGARVAEEDRKSTRLNSSHRCISYAVFCLKKKKDEDAYATGCGSTQEDSGWRWGVRRVGPACARW